MKGSEMEEKPEEMSERGGKCNGTREERGTRKNEEVAGRDVK